MALEGSPQGRLHLDDLRAQIPQQLSGHETLFVAQIQNPVSREQPIGVSVQLFLLVCAHHGVRQKKGDLRKRDEDGQGHHVNAHKPRGSLEDLFQGDLIAHHPLDHIDVEAHGRGDEADLQIFDDDDAEPYGAEFQGFDDREDNGKASEASRRWYPETSPKRYTSPTSPPESGKG